MPRRIAMLVFPDVQILDVTGPLEVFARSSRWLRDEGHLATEAYSVELVGVTRGLTRTSSGLELHTRRGIRELGGDVDTVLIPGGMGVEAVLSVPPVLDWLRTLAPRVRRLASVCTGAFILAEAGLLDGLTVTTHWASADELARRYPRLRVEPDRIFVKQGKIYTSAGVTAGMDLALAHVEEDHGRRAALGVARALVMFVKRPGGLTQLSATLEHDVASRDPLREVQSYIAAYPAADLSAQVLARRAGMSLRNFFRAFRAELGTGPARYVTEIRIEAARRLLEDSTAPLTEVARASGFGSCEAMRRAFVQRLGVAPNAYREPFRRRAV